MCAPPPPYSPWPQLLDASVSMFAHAGGCVGTTFVCAGIQTHGCDYDNGRLPLKAGEVSQYNWGPWECLITQQLGGPKLRAAVEPCSKVAMKRFTCDLSKVL